MSNGEKMYYAMKRHIKRALIRDFDPDWDVLCEEAYKGFIRDMAEDLEAEVQVSYPNSGEDDETIACTPDEIEFYYRVTDNVMEVIERRHRLSDLLIEAYEYDGTDLLPALGRSLDRFYEHVKNTSENNS